MLRTKIYADFTPTSSRASPDTSFLLRVLVGLLLSTVLTGGMAISLAVRLMNEPSLQIAFN